MPDRRQGYVKRGRGILPSDAAEAARYRDRQLEPTANFDEVMQRLLIDEAIVAAEKRRFRLHGVATEPTHVHVLVSWVDERDFVAVKRGLRELLSRRLNAHPRRHWLAHDGSRKRVRDYRHFN